MNYAVWVEVPEELTSCLDSIIPVVGGFAQYHHVIDALGMEKAKDLVPDVRTCAPNARHRLRARHVG